MLFDELLVDIQNCIDDFQEVIALLEVAEKLIVNSPDEGPTDHRLPDQLRALLRNAVSLAWATHNGIELWPDRLSEKQPVTAPAGSK